MLSRARPQARLFRVALHNLVDLVIDDEMCVATFTAFFGKNQGQPAPIPRPGRNATAPSSRIAPYIDRHGHDEPTSEMGKSATQVLPGIEKDVEHGGKCRAFEPIKLLHCVPVEKTPYGRVPSSGSNTAGDGTSNALWDAASSSAVRPPTDLDVARSLNPNSRSALRTLFVTKDEKSALRVRNRSSSGWQPTLMMNIEPL